MTYEVIAHAYALSGMGLQWKATIQCNNAKEVLTIFFNEHWPWEYAPTSLTMRLI